MATVTSLNVRLLLHDVSFTKTLQKSEKEAEKFAKSVHKVSGGLGTLAAAASNISGVASATAGAESAITRFSGAISTSTSTTLAAVNAVVGLRAAFTALSLSMATNPLGVAMIAAATAIGVVLSLMSKANGEMAEAEEYAQRMEELANRWRDAKADIATRERQLGMDAQQKEMDAMRVKLSALFAAGQITTEQYTAQMERYRNILLKEQEIGKAREAAGKKQGEMQSLDKIADETANMLAGVSAINQEMARLEGLGLNPDQLDIARQILEERERANKVVADRAELNRQISDFEAAANQAWMTDQEKKIAKLKELGATEAQIAAARRSMEKAGEPQKRQKELAEQIAEGRKVMQGLEQQARAIEGARGSGLAANPQAMLKGTAQAALAESARKNPVEQLTDIQKKSLEELKKQKLLQERQLAFLEKEQERVAQF